jgi:hypothetical protein
VTLRTLISTEWYFPGHHLGQEGKARDTHPRLGGQVVRTRHPVTDLALSDEQRDTVRDHQHNYHDKKGN